MRHTLGRSEVDLSKLKHTPHLKTKIIKVHNGHFGMKFLNELGTSWFSFFFILKNEWNNYR